MHTTIWILSGTTWVSRRVVPPSDKINNSAFHLQNQGRPPHSNAYVFKILAPICTIEQRDILIMPVTSFSSTAQYKWCHLAKDKNLYTV